MAIHNASVQTIRRGSQRSGEVTRLPAPTGGMDSRQSLAAGDPSLCIYSYNMIPAVYGMLVRRGYQEHVENIDGGSGGGVRTLVPYTGEPNSGLGDRLFAMTADGIFDVTSFNTPPVLKVAFGVNTEAAGHGVYTAYTTDAEENILFYADEANVRYE